MADADARTTDPGSLAQIAQVRTWVHDARRVTVLTGAGISTDSGIPDFRGPQGVWTRNPGAARMFTLQAYLENPDLRRQVWRTRREHPAWTSEPNPAHHALVDLERSGRLRALITQNIDGLHQRAGSAPEKVIELHGTLYETECVDCAHRIPTTEAFARVDAGEDDPACARCGGILKAATVSFGQSLDPAVLRSAVDAATDADLFLAVGTSLQVQPAAALCTLATDHGARLVIVNAEPTPYDATAAVVLRTPIGQALPALVPPSG